MQWVSTFASGASSLGRPRRLVDHPAESGPPSSRGTFGENSPHIYKEHPGRKKQEKIFEVVTISEKAIQVHQTARRIGSDDNFRITNDTPETDFWEPNIDSPQARE